MTTSTIKHLEKNKILSCALVSLIWLAVWEGLSLFINEDLLFTSPVSVVLSLADLVRTAEYWMIILGSVVRIVGGFLLGFAIAFILAFFSYKSDFFRTLISPAISVIKSTPVASFIILALMWIGKDFVPLAIGTLMVMPIVWSNVLEGLKSIDCDLLEMSQVYHFSIFKRIKNIYIPSLIPFCTAAVSSGLGLCWKAGIAAEVICRTLPSIGNSIWETKFYLKTSEMFAWTATVIILSVAFDLLLRQLSKPVLRHYGYLSESETNVLPQAAKQASVSAEELMQSSSEDQAFAQTPIENEFFIGAAERQISAQSSAICIENLSFSYGAERVIENLNFEISGKGISVISAPSGAGKTTLLRIIAGLLLPDDGSVCGVPDSISYVFQEERLLPWATALENVMLVGNAESPCAAITNSADSLRERAQSLLSALGISRELSQKLPSALSGGERRRVCIARALFFCGNVLLLDEPFVGLDKENRARALTLIRSYAETRPVVLVSHAEEDLREADHIIKL